MSDLFHHLPGVVPIELCEQWVTRALAARCDDRTKVAVAASEFERSTGLIKHELLDGRVVRALLPELEAIYHSIRPLAQLLLGRPLLSGLYPRSDVNVLIYRNDSKKDAHFDTVPATLVLQLTKHQPGEAVFRYRSGEAEERSLEMGQGDALVFSGRQVLHSMTTSKMPKGDSRVSVNANYYEPTDRDRDTVIDDLLYGGHRS